MFCGRRMMMIPPQPSQNHLLRPHRSGSPTLQHRHGDAHRHLHLQHQHKHKHQHRPGLSLPTSCGRDHHTNTKPPPSFRTAPPQNLTFPHLAYPTPHILLVTLNRPSQLNCVSSAAHYELESVFRWYDSEPQLRCAIVTGAGRAFCAGADLKEWNQLNELRRGVRGEGEGGGDQRVRETTTAGGATARPRVPPGTGFAGLGKRYGKKPVIGAVNGLALGGGMEVVSSMDLVVASRRAVFGLPEVKRGAGALTGVLPRLMMCLGRQRVMEMALTGRTLSAEEGERWGFVNALVDDDDDGDDAGAQVEVMERPVVKRALEYAEMIAGNSPDSVIVLRDAVMAAWYEANVEDATRVVQERWEERLSQGYNSREGVQAFVEKREPRWKNSEF